MPSNKGIGVAISNRCIATSSKKLLVAIFATSSNALVTSSKKILVTRAKT